MEKGQQAPGIAIQDTKNDGPTSRADIGDNQLLKNVVKILRVLSFLAG